MHGRFEQIADADTHFATSRSDETTPCGGENLRMQARRLRLRVRGRVQGVGFRPHIWRLANRANLSGFVLNDQDGVLMEVQGTNVDAFVRDLVALAPPLACIDAIETEERDPLATDEQQFVIRDSTREGPARTAISPDIATCPACLAELFDPSSRRYLYPFITCTQCGPRFTITHRLPYDRATTAMAAFPLCAACAAEYADPADRRFHAETTGCAACGPRLAMPVEAVGARLRAGQIVALKGLGGFHLLCDARNDFAVRRLRARKQRDGKPFAVMVPNRATAQRFAVIDDIAATVLEHPARPIVIVPARPGERLADGSPARLVESVSKRPAAGVAMRLADGISNGLPALGLFLPYTPLHWLVIWELLGRPAGVAWMSEAADLALVATSANRSGEPIVIDGAEQRERFAGVVDAVADHDRPIVTRADDSVVRMVAGAPAFVRRARGFTPTPIRLARELPTVVALGAQLKATVTVIRGREAFVSQHVGDLDTPAAAAFLEATLRRMLSVLDVAPVAVACDLHPDFASTRLAHRLGLPVWPVQHHHAHIAALAAEHGNEQPLLGLALDGFGLGSDGAAWGGELLFVDGAHCERVGHLATLPAPGGDRAASEPWRMAAAALQTIGRAGEIERRFAAEPLARPVRALLARGIACQPTSSAGRWFDAVAGVLGVSHRQSFEGEAAMRLEALATETAVLPDGWCIRDGVLDLLPLFGRLADGMPPAAGAALFHGTLIAALVAWAERAAASLGLRTVALGGGCFLNKVLTEGVVSGLTARGLRPLVARAVPPNDGGLSLGQAFIVASALENGRTQEEIVRCVSQFQ